MSNHNPQVDPEHDIPIEIVHIGLTSPCPVRVNERGEAVDAEGEFLPDEQRDQYCAVDAAWLIGSQRCCDVHLRWAFEHGGIDGTFEELLEDVYGQHGAFYFERARERALRPWSERTRYTQDEAESWALDAKAMGLA